MNKFTKRLLSSFLSCTFLFTQYPVLAEGLSNLNVSDLDSKEISKPCEPEILDEITEKREEFVKHFRMSDGSITAVVYSDQVHYKDGNEFKEIDNTLVENNEEYINTESPVKIKLSKKFRNEKLVTLSSENHELSWSYLRKDKKVLKSETLKEVSQDIDSSSDSTANSKSEAVIIENFKTKSKRFLNKKEEKTNTSKVFSKAKYKRAEPEVDLEYAVSGLGIKENIILNEKLSDSDNSSFDFEFKTNDLKIEKESNGDLNFKDQNEKTVFIMPKGSMWDSSENSANSSEVEYEFKEINEGYIISVIPDKDWLNSNERVYPVTIDPSITKTVSTGVMDIQCSSANPNSNYKHEQHLSAGYSSEYTDRWVSYIKCTNLPGLSHGEIITNAKLRLKPLPGENSFGTGPNAYGYSPNNQISVKNIKQTWNDNISWSTKPDSDDTHLDYIVTSSETINDWNEWDITRAAKNWYTLDNPNDNYGLEMCSMDYNLVSIMRYVSTRNETYSTERPQFEFNYKNFIGTELYWSYSSHSAGLNGVGRVNNYSGSLSVSENILSYLGLRNPLSVTNTYSSTNFNEHANSYVHEKTFENGYSYSSSTGHGWSLDFNQMLYPIISTDPMYGQGFRYVYVDGDGTWHYFKETTLTDESQVTTIKIIDEDGLGLEIKPYKDDQGNINQNILCLLDKGGNKLTFERKSPDSQDNTCFTLISSQDFEGNEIEYEYTPIVSLGGQLKITTIKEKLSKNSDPNLSNPVQDRITTITYEANGKVSKITKPDHEVNKPREINFEYDLEKLTKITYPGGLYTGYSYDSDGRLSKVSTNEGTGRSVTYEYSAHKIGSLYKTPIYKNRIKKVTEYGSETPKNSTMGNHITFSYDPGGNATKIQHGSGNEATVYGKGAENWLFDNMGRMTSVMGENGEMFTQQYAVQNLGDPKSNKISHINTCSKHIENLVRNPDARDNLNNWFPSSWTTSSQIPNGVSVEASTEEKVIGEKSFKITQNRESPEWIVVTQAAGVPKLTEDTYYTFSADMKIAGELTGSEGASILFSGAKGAEHTTTTWNSDLRLSTNNEWVRVHQTVKIPAGTEYLYFGFSLMNSNGTVYFDRLQLEEGNVPNDYNMIENSAFDHDLSSWTSNDFESNDGISDHELKIYGNPSKKKYVFQNIPVNKVNPHFTLSSTVKSKSVPYKNNENRYGGCFVKVAYTFSDGTEENSPDYPFTPPYSDYPQFVCTGLSPYFSDKTVKSITVYLMHYQGANEVYFDNVQLNIDDFGTSYDYDKNGNLSKTVDKTGKVTETPRDPESNEVTNINTPGSFARYEYDKINNRPHRLISSEVPASSGSDGAIKSEFQYDDFGNVTKNEIKGEGQKFIESTSSYTNSGNYLIKSTDSRGYSVNFEYDSEKSGKPVKITAPNASETTYEYDDKDFLIRAQNGSSQSNYSYTNGVLSSVSHKINSQISVTYNFIRDIFGKITGTKIGNQTITSNIYDSCNGLLRGTLYSSGAAVNYDYDKYGQLIQKSYTGKKGEGQFNYDYNNKGQLYRIRDSVNNRDKTFNYDVFERLVSTHRSDGVSKEYSYNKANLIDKESFKANGVNQTKFNSFLLGNRLRGTTIKTNGIDFCSDYFVCDYLGRRQHLALSSLANPDCGLINYWNYLDVDGTDKTTSFVKEIIYKLRKNGNYSQNPDLKFSYDYDSMGNISKIYEDDSQNPKAEYFYDDRNQLKHENNAYLNKTIRYQYDDGGNIRSKAVYTLTLGNSDSDLDVLTPESTVNYGYADENWKDKLTSYNGKTITYDSIGNPLNYLNGWNFEWKNGRQLDKMVNSGYNVNVSCKYDEGSVRTQKTVKSIKDGNEITKTTDFITDGIQILSQKTTTVVTDIATENQVADPATDTIIWQIDGEGTVLGFIHNNGVYYYLKNAQGDIVGIADKDSNIVANYTYDSWGKIVSIIDPSQDNLDVTGDTNHIGYINPLRYRGYYYDQETGLYCLNARYYDPETCRFINSDNNLEGGLNLFAYCGNNSVNYYDPEGNKKFYTLVVLYDPDDFSKQADDEAKWLAKNYDEEESSVIKTEIKSKTGFIDEWNKYLNKENKDYIIMSLIFHGSPKHLYPGENLMSSDIKELDVANLVSLRILACNAGHKDYEDNVANAFKSRHNINSIYAMDGNLSFYPRNWNLIGHDLSKYGPRLSHKQNDFKKYAKNGRKPSGFYTL